MWIIQPDRRTSVRSSAGCRRTASGGAICPARSRRLYPLYGFGEGPEIINPSFVEHTPWPYIRGPNYTRPVFKEHSREGNFALSPIIRMPSLGAADTQAAVTDTDATSPASPSGMGAQVTPESMCSSITDASAYAKCVQFNRKLLAATAADPAKASQYVSQLEAATAKCEGAGDINAWASCFYGQLDSSAPWYKNPWVIGGAVTAVAVGLGLLTQWYRQQ